MLRNILLMLFYLLVSVGIPSRVQPYTDSERFEGTMWLCVYLAAFTGVLYGGCQILVAGGEGQSYVLSVRTGMACQ